MPLQSSHAHGKEYIRRVRVYVDPDERDRGASRSQFSFIFPLKNIYENVIACELVDYTVRSRLQRTFVEETGGLPGNNMVDIHMEDVATGLEVLDFTLVIPPETFTAPLASLTSLLNTQMDAQGHAYHNTGNGVVWTVTTLDTQNAKGQDGALQFKVERLATPDTIEASFLFGSGTNRRNSAAAVLGFEPGVDTAPFTDALGTTWYYPVPDYTTTVTPFRHLNVFVREFPELAPLATIALTSTTDYSVNRQETPHNTRLLTEPVATLDQLRVDLTLPDGRFPTTEQCGAVDLVFDLLMLSPETSVPRWLKQQFKY